MIYDCVIEVRKYGVIIIVDGGIKFFGDIMKVLVFGGYVVMFGSLFVGILESLGEIEIY